MSAWQPMETAPRDGTPVLVLCAEPVDRSGAYVIPTALSHIALAWFEPHGETWHTSDVKADWVEYGEFTGGAMEHEHVLVEPSGWLPIPSA